MARLMRAELRAMPSDENDSDVNDSWLTRIASCLRVYRNTRDSGDDDDDENDLVSPLVRFGSLVVVFDDDDASIVVFAMFISFSSQNVKSSHENFDI